MLHGFCRVLFFAFAEIWGGFVGFVGGWVVLGWLEGFWGLRGGWGGGGGWGFGFFWGFGGSIWAFFPCS